MKNGCYDIIISGAGLAGLSLAYRAFKEGVWNHEKVLIIDKDEKKNNDRTWCFWQSGPSSFEDIIYRQWEEMLFFSHQNEKVVLESAPYRYKMIRGIDFYRYTLDYLKNLPNVTFKIAEIMAVQSEGGICSLSTSQQETFRSTYLFNSVYAKPEVRGNQQYFLQHFKGVHLHVPDFEGDSMSMHLMDFRTSQENGATFFYVLPFNREHLFVEYTLFSKSLLSPEQYDLKIREYIETVLCIGTYQIGEVEFGVIPMTDYPFERSEDNLINIGSMGGDTRGSTGYTFSNVQRTVDKILESFKSQGHPHFKVENIGKKHQLYDKTLLRVLDRARYQGHQLFSDMFHQVPARDVFAFLDGVSSFQQDLKVMRALKTKHFIGPFLKSLVGMV